jgi:hypothetical protein
MCSHGSVTLHGSGSFFILEHAWHISLTLASLAQSRLSFLGDRFVTTVLSRDVQPPLLCPPNRMLRTSIATATPFAVISSDRHMPGNPDRRIPHALV